MNNIVKAPPDGGWGWMVVLGGVIINVCILPLHSCFGILFGDLLKELKIETTGAALITSTSFAVICFSGLLAGPIIRRFSYRKVAVFGGILCSLGLLLTIPARSMTHILFTYSILYGIGDSLSASAIFVALNNYFVKRRGVAFGLSFAGGLIGTIVLPHAIRLFLERYGFPGTTMLLGGIMLHTLIGACFLQPAKWHLVSASKCENEKLPTMARENGMPTTDETPLTLFGKEEVSGGLGSATDIRKVSIVNSSFDISPTCDTFLPHTSSRPVGVAYENEDLVRNIDFTKILDRITGQGNYSLSPIETPKNKMVLLRKLVKFFYLDLLKDPIYLNLVFGIAMYYVSEQNFKMLAVFFYESIGFDKRDISLLVSIQAIADLFSRLILPTVCDMVPITKRIVFMVAVAILAIVRSAMAFQTGFTNIIICLLASGFIRGICSVYSCVALSEYSPPEKFHAVFGLHMVGRGIFIITLGPLLGYFRDTSNSFPLCIHLQSFLLMLCFIAWSVEYIARWTISKNKRCYT